MRAGRRVRWRLGWVGACATLVAFAWSGADAVWALTLRSGAFSAGGEIPRRYTCDGADVSPPLQWDGVPQGTKSFVLLCEDPDAPGGMWVHWVAHGIPASARQLPEGVAEVEELADGTRQGMNDFRRLGYGGPCPPRGTRHRYFFRLYALDAPLAVGPKADRARVLEAMRGHVLEEAELMGTYARP